MSFPRAKIQRFNDVMNSVPSPTKYDPKIVDKVKGGCILKSEAKQAAVAETASASSGKSCQTPVFRTPHLPKRHNCLGTAEKSNVNAYKSISFKSEDMELLNNNEDTEELKALRVECFNKTETINDLEKHIQELKTQIADSEKLKNKWEIYISELETAKSNLECILSNNANYEQQIITYQLKIQEMEEEIKCFVKTKEELLLKIEETEKKYNVCEESNFEHERKVINLEGTIEQLQIECKNKEEIITEMLHKEKMYKMNHKVSLECLQGKILSLENEIKELELGKGKNEKTIFGLESELSNLNCNIEHLKTEKSEIEIACKELKSNLEKMETNCKNHSDTITGLEMELENRVKELQNLRNVIFKAEINAVRTNMEKERVEMEKEFNQIIQNQEKKLAELREGIQEQKILFESERNTLIADNNSLRNSHAEEILQLQNDYESKLLAQMQEGTDKINNLQCRLDERETGFHQINIKYKESLSEWEKKLEEAEDNFADTIKQLQEQHVDELDELKNSFKKKIETVEFNSAKISEMKNKEIDLLSEGYKEILEEMKALLLYLEERHIEIGNLTATNKNLNARIKLMLEEIKLLNEENETKSENFNKMRANYKQEFNKNEQLSCKLGELDTKIIHLKEDLNTKTQEWKKASDELKKSNSYCERITIKNKDLEVLVSELQEKINKLEKELNEKKKSFEENISALNEELTLVRTQCRKFEIITGNTSKSLDALRIRLIESEKEVQKLNSENSSLIEKLEKTDNEKNSFQKQYETMLETKLDLETAIDEYLSSNRELTEKYAQLASLFNESEVKIKDLTKINEDLKAEKQNHLDVMKNLVREHELQLIETEKATLDHVEQISQTLTNKLEFFTKFSSEKIFQLSNEINALKSENEKVNESLKSKGDEYDNLFTDYEILKTTVDISVKESEKLKMKCEDQIHCIEELECSLEELRSEKDKAEKKLIEKGEKLTELMEEYEGLRKQLCERIKLQETEKELNDKIRVQVNNLESRIKEYEISAADKSKAMEGLEKKVQALESQIREKDSVIASCQEEKVLCMQEIKSLSSEKSDVLFDLKISEKKLEATVKLVEELRSEKIQAQENNRKQKIEFDGLMAEKCNLDSELSYAKQEISNLKLEKSSLSQVEERKLYYKTQCSRLEKLNKELESENMTLKNDFNQIHAFLQDRDKIISDLTKRCGDLESLIGPFREQLETYETERMLIENDREQLRKQHLEQAAELGHKNHKQKIRHVVNLKNALLERRKENEKLTLEIKNLKKKVQKLQEELGHDPKRLFIGGKRPASTPFKGKENNGLMTPSGGLMTPIVIKQEPMSPGSPLRNRNQ